jgi:hypothetical protein
LKGHPDAVLVFATVVMAVGMCLKGINRFIAIGVSGAFDFDYCLRSLAQDEHKERLAEMGVTRLKSGKGTSIKTRNGSQVRRARDRQNGPQGWSQFT